MTTQIQSRPACMSYFLPVSSPAMELRIRLSAWTFCIL
jgi:hypothetical protein